MSRRARACDRRTDPGCTKSSGLCSSLSEPTALSERMRSTPSDFNAVNIGAKIQLRGRDAMPASVARQKRDLLARQLARPRKRPKARRTASRSARSSCASNPGMEYNPLPPIIPIVGFMSLISIPAARRRWTTGARRHRDVRRRRRAAHSAGARPRRASRSTDAFRSGTLKRDVMQSFAALVEKFSDHRIRLRGLQQLDARARPAAASRR